MFRVPPASRRVRFGALSAAFFAALSLLAACGQSREEAPKPRTVSAPTVRVGYQEALECSSLPGQVESRNSVVLSSKVSGTVTAVYAEEGALVQKGQPILQIDDSELRQREKSAQSTAGQAELQRQALAAKAALARTNLQRMEKLLEQKAVSRDDFDRARAEYLSLKSQEEALAASVASAGHQREEVRSLLAYSTVTAPLTGILAKRNVDLGSFVNAGAPLASIDDVQGGFDITAQGDETLLPRVRQGMTVLAQVPSLSQRPFLTELSAVVGHVDPATRTFKVKAELPAVDGNATAHAGMFGKVCVPLSQARKLLVPAEAVRLRGDLPTALVVDQDGVLRLRLLKIGATYLRAEVGGKAYILQSQAEAAPPEGALVEVLAGLSEGEIIVAGGSETLREGDHLAAKP